VPDETFLPCKEQFTLIQSFVLDSLMDFKIRWPAQHHRAHSSPHMSQSEHQRLQLLLFNEKYERHSTVFYKHKTCIDAMFKVKGGAGRGACLTSVMAHDCFDKLLDLEKLCSGNHQVTEFWTCFFAQYRCASSSPVSSMSQHHQVPGSFVPLPT
jgi:hypothetical protein